MEYEYRNDIDPTLFIANRHGEWFETVCYCPVCRKKGLKIYTISNGKKERCIVCNPGRKKRDNKQPTIYTETRLRRIIKEVCSEQPLTVDDLCNILKTKEHFIKKSLKVMLFHNKIEYINDYIYIK